MENDISIRDEEDIEERRESDEGEQFTEAAPKKRERDIRDKEESEEGGKYE